MNCIKILSLAYRFGLGDRLVSGLTSVAGVAVVLAAAEVAAAIVAGAVGGAVA